MSINQSACGTRVNNGPTLLEKPLFVFIFSPLYFIYVLNYETAFISFLFNGSGLDSHSDSPSSPRGPGKGTTVLNLSKSINITVQKY